MACVLQRNVLSFDGYMIRQIRARVILSILRGMFNDFSYISSRSPPLSPFSFSVRRRRDETAGDQRVSCHSHAKSIRMK